MDRQIITPVMALHAMTETAAILRVSIYLPPGLAFVSTPETTTTYYSNTRLLVWQNLTATTSITPSGHPYVVQVDAADTPSLAPVNLVITGTCESDSGDVFDLNPLQIWVGVHSQPMTITPSGGVLSPDGSRIQVTYGPNAVTQTTVTTMTLYRPTALPYEPYAPGLVISSTGLGEPMVRFDFHPDVVFSSSVTITVDLSDVLTSEMIATGYIPNLFYQQEGMQAGAGHRPAGATTDNSLQTVNSAYDPGSSLMSAQVGHFSAYQVGVQFDAPKVWKLNTNFGDVNLFNGSAQYAYPINAPKMLDGLQPQLALQYASTSADQGSRDSNSLGVGWSMDVPRIYQSVRFDEHSETRFIIIHWPYEEGTWCSNLEGCVEFVPYPYYWFTLAADHDFKLSLNGQNYNLIPKGGGEYVTENYTPMRVRFCGITTTICGGTGEVLTTTAPANGYWQVWTPDGTRYGFGLDDSSQTKYRAVDRGMFKTGDERGAMTQSWYLQRVFAAHRDDPSQNPSQYSAQYSYEKAHKEDGYVDYDTDTRLVSVKYGNSASARSTRYEIAIGYTKTRIDKEDVRQPVTFTVNVSNTVIERSVLTYDVSHTLSSIQSFALSGTQAISQPFTSFEYQGNLLTAVNNGYGARQEYLYRNDPGTAYHQVALKTIREGLGWSSQQRYAYSGSCYNKAGSTCRTNHDWNKPSNALMGYAVVTVTALTNANTVTAATAHFYYTDTQRLGREYQSRSSDPTGAVMQAQQVSFTVYLTNAGLISGTWFVAPLTVTARLSGRR